MKAKATRKSEFLAAALRQFARHGFAATTTRNIMEDLGLSAAALYYHFPSKADLLYEVLTSNYEPMLRGLHDLLDSLTDSSPDIRLSQAVKYTSLLFMTRRREMRLIEADSRFLAQDKQNHINTILKEYNSAIRQVIVEGVNDGLWHVDDISTFTNMLFGLMQCRWYRSHGPKSPEEIADIVVEMTGHLLQSPLPLTSVPLLDRMSCDSSDDAQAAPRLAARQAG